MLHQGFLLLTVFWFTQWHIPLIHLPHKVYTDLHVCCLARLTEYLFFGPKYCSEAISEYQISTFCSWELYPAVCLLHFTLAIQPLKELNSLQCIWLIYKYMHITTTLTSHIFYITNTRHGYMGWCEKWCDVLHIPSVPTPDVFIYIQYTVYICS